MINPRLRPLVFALLMTGTAVAAQESSGQEPPTLIRAAKAHVQARVLRISNRRLQLAGADL